MVVLIDSKLQKKIAQHTSLFLSRPSILQVLDPYIGSD